MKMRRLAGLLIMALVLQCFAPVAVYAGESTDQESQGGGDSEELSDTADPPFENGEDVPHFEAGI